MYYDIASRIKQLRKNANLSQEQAALAADITPVFWGQIERGEKNPTVVTVEKICGVFNISLSEFFSNQEYVCSKGDIQDKIDVMLRRFSDDEKKEVCKIIKSLIKLKDN